MLAYLSRYTHRVAIANRRLMALDEASVTFRYKDHRRNGAERPRTMTLAADDFKSSVGSKPCRFSPRTGAAQTKPALSAA